eukprot:CAMPEP_0119369072 /NCGR_PEP_ID=MMETSP1334-20130426/15647_1 /TAXON_ID=127549 /ORGANISM="Calcidiscus leptoporus, Strain RCC1130" /LENGTH=290 /DNA_ID=CAMNT_0007385847 /DNA_START=334 /DNA_END=1204 /DNA_ORIENTATION=-
MTSGTACCSSAQRRLALTSPETFRVLRAAEMSMSSCAARELCYAPSCRQFLFRRHASRMQSAQPPALECTASLLAGLASPYWQPPARPHHAAQRYLRHASRHHPLGASLALIVLPLAKSANTMRTDGSMLQPDSAAFIDERHARKPLDACSLIVRQLSTNAMRTHRSARLSPSYIILLLAISSHRAHPSLGTGRALKVLHRAVSMHPSHPPLGAGLPLKVVLHAIRKHLPHHPLGARLAFVVHDRAVGALRPHLSRGAPLALVMPSAYKRGEVARLDEHAPYAASEKSTA